MVVSPGDCGGRGEFSGEATSGVTAEIAECAERRMAKFTAILEIGGGTYIRQVKATSPSTALRKLATVLANVVKTED